MKLQDLGTFLSRHARVLLEHVARAYPPVVQDAGELPDLLRPPLGKQALAIEAATRALEKYGAAIVVGEMGSGKSYIAAATAHRSARRTLVLCPPHLVEKWKQEVEATVPGAQTVIAESIRDLEAARKQADSGAPLFVIMSRERAKLGAPLVNGGIFNHRGTARCLHCSAAIRDKHGVPLGYKAAMKLQRPVCESCGAPLYAPDPKRVRRKDGTTKYPLAEYVKRRMPNFFDLLVLDEAHEYKAADSAQGIAAGILAEAVPKTLILTGTLFGGYASTLFYLLWRFVRPFREHFGYDEVKRFVQAYGAVEYVETTYKTDRGVTTRRGNVTVRSKEIPATSPLLLYFLLPFTVFLKLSDVADALPPYVEEVRQVDPGDELKGWYDTLIRWFDNRDLRNNPQLLGSFFHAGVFAPDTATEGFAIENDEDGESYEHPPLAMDLLPKECELLKLVEEERAAGRKVIVFVQNTSTRNLAARLERILNEAGHRARALYSSTTTARKREAWIRKAQKEGLDVLVLHPRLVQTGLDLIDFPTLVYYQVEPSVYVLRQAARRSWRIGQKRPVRVVYMVYRGTLQERALAQLASKAQASLALEGHLLEGGLNNMAGGEASVSLARALAGARNVEFDPGLIKIATLGVDAPAESAPAPEAPKPAAPPDPAPKARKSKPLSLPTVAELAAQGLELRGRRKPPSAHAQFLFPELLKAG